MEQFNCMKIAVLIALFSLPLPLAAAPDQSGAQPPQARSASPDRVGEAYLHFMLGHRLEEADDTSGAITEYKRAIELDPSAPDIQGELAGLYLRENKVQEAMATAEQALKLAPSNREANRVLGTIYAALSESTNETPARGRSSAAADENIAKAIGYLEVASERSAGEVDPNIRATLARLYVRSGAYDKAIPVLNDLVNQEPGWQDGPLMLAEAYAGAGRTKDAIAWLEERTADDPRLLPALADFYERERRWPDAASTYSRAIQRLPRNTELKSRYASALLNMGGRENAAKARDVLTEVVAARTTAPDARALYMLSQAQRRLGDYAAAEGTARRVIAQNSKSPWGFYALAESLEERRQYQAIVDELAPVVAEYRGKGADAFDVGILLPHLGFAYQELGQYDKAVAAFEEARKLAPDDPAVAGYLIDAHLAAKKYGAAADVAKAALVQHPNDLRLARLQARALRLSGKTDQGIAVLEEAVKNHSGEPLAYISLAQIYADADRGSQAVRVLQDAQTKFPSVDAISFELGAVFDKQKKFTEADYLKKALAIEPENGSFLDSLGWAYFKADKLDLAEDNLRRAADQLKTNSVIQEHYGQVLFKLGRYDEAIAAWTRALNGDGDSIDKSGIDKKIRAAKQKLPKK
jgi:tetratricopeptide (TPR) repeat protein